MKELFKNKKTKLLFFILSIIVIVIIIIFGRSNKAKKIDNIVNKEQTDQLIPTLTEDDVMVGLKSKVAGKEIIFSVEKILGGTTSFDYQFSYKTQSKGLQGVIGTVSSDDFKDGEYRKEIILGTCSSGTCIYHNVVGKIDLTLRFHGDYGEKIFEKSYQL